MRESSCSACKLVALTESIKEGVIAIEDVNKKLNSDIVSNSEEF